MIVYTCQHCQSKLRVEDTWAGKGIRCPKCHQVGAVVVAAGSSSAEIPVVSPPHAASEPALPSISVHAARASRSGAIAVSPVVVTAPQSVQPASSSSVAPVVLTKASSASRSARATAPKRKSNQSLLLAAAVGGILLVGGGLALYLLNSAPPDASRPTLLLEPITHQETIENKAFKTTAKLKQPKPGARPVFSFDLAPSGASIDPTTGKITWTPTEKDGPKEHSFVVRVKEGGASATQNFSVKVLEDHQPPRLPALTELAAKPGEATKLRIVGDDPDLPKSPLRYSLQDAPPGAEIDEKTGEFRWTPDEASAGKRFAFSVVASKEGTKEPAMATLAIRVAGPQVQMVAAVEPAAVTPAPAPMPTTPSVPLPEPKPANSELDELLALYDETLPKNKLQRKLFAPANYKELRNWFSRKFAREQEQSLRKAWGDKYDEMNEWLDANLEFKEELYTALQPEHDDVVAAMQILARLKAEFPKEIVRYGSLAIATCVVWDRKQGIYDYEDHASRAKAAMPAAPADSVENFRYLVEREKAMEGRILYVPWEYLTLVVNHQTPLQERDWALANYGPRRVMFGSCYKDCPYDQLMLKTDSAQARLNGKDYNFVTLKQFGGVCAHQADYSSRIGKSIGVPAAYVEGDGRFAGAGHAWVMWVELMAVSPNAIKFKLESYGRYNDDHYYVGHLNDPQTGKRISDRDLERRLHAVGANTQGRRHAELAMRAWPMISGARELEFPAQLAYLSQTLSLSPWNEQAWRLLAGATRTAELTAIDRKEIQKAFVSLFTTFAQLPDLTVEIFGDLLAFETKPKKQIEYYFQLLEMYAAGKRPDLSFQALPQLVQLLVGENRQADAVAALAAAIKKNANEGQYVPAALDRLEALCAGDEKLQASLLAFYGEFLPLISTNRFGEVSDYCVAMHERAIGKFQAAGQTGPVQTLRARLQAIQAAGRAG